MSEVNNSETKWVIDTVIERLKNQLKEDYEPREDLDFTDIFFPKLCAIYGTKICLAINEGANITDMLSQRGLTDMDFNRIESFIKAGKEFVEGKDNSIDSILEVDRAYDNSLRSYALKVRDKLKSDKKEIDLEIIEEAIENSFDLNTNIYTPCSEYEMNNNKKM